MINAIDLQGTGEAKIAFVTKGSEPILGWKASLKNPFVLKIVDKDSGRTKLIVDFSRSEIESLAQDIQDSLRAYNEHKRKQ